MKRKIKSLFFLIPLVGLSSIVYSTFSPKVGSNKPDSKKLKIVYNVLLTKSCENYEVFVMNPDGSEKKNISNWAGSDWAYATYEDKIYFVSDRDSVRRMWFLYEMDVNGKNVRRISDIRLDDSYVSVRKSGKEIVVCPYTKGEKYFLIMNIRSGKILDTINIPFANIGDPCFSKDGKQIVFRGAKEKKGIDELFIMNSDGTEIKQLTHYPKSDTTAKWYEYHAGPPVWEYNSGFISYTSKQNNNLSIFKIKTDGSSPGKLTDDKINEGWHSWSPDGNLLVFDASDLENSNYDIYLMNLAEKSVQRLTNDTLVEQAPLFVKCGK